MAIIAAPVIAWATAGATAIGIGATTAAAIGALAGAVAVGVVTGAVMGAVTAAITGGDILEGALKGAIIGGVSAGVISGLGMATGLSTAAEQTAAWGAGPVTAQTPGVGAVEAGTGNIAIEATGNLAQGAVPNMGDAIHGANAANPVAVTPAQQSGGLLSGMSDKTLEVVSGAAEGALSGLGQMGASMMEGSSAEELAEWKAEQAAIDKAGNMPGEFTAQTANIEVPEWWNNYLNPSSKTKTGILSKGATA